MSAYRVAASYALIIMVIGTVVFQIFPEQMIGIFADPNNPEATAALIELGVPALRIISLSFVFASFGIMNSTMFQAIGHGLASLVVSVFRQLLGILPVAVLLAKLFGLTAVWYAFPIAEAVALVLSFFVLMRIDKHQLRKMESAEGDTPI